MAYFKVENGVVAQKQSNAEDGFIEGPDDVYCGYLYKSGKFSAPAVALDWPALIAARRFQAETGGVTVQGIPVNTERDSQSLLTGAAFAASLDPAYQIKWKAATGFVDLTAQQIIGVASAVRAFVQACFNREAELLGAVADRSITAEMLEEGWPA